MSKSPLKIAVIGGGPAGSFFAFEILSRAKDTGQAVEVCIFEKKDDLHFHSPDEAYVCKGGCNYCAGGISPRLAQVLLDRQIILPDDLVVGNVSSIIVHGHWKNIKLPVPFGKKMFTVFRGSRPRGRREDYYNFDSFILSRARELGAELVLGQAVDVGFDPDAGKVNVRYKAGGNAETMTADFVVFAGGVNQSIARDFAKNPILPLIKKMIPLYRPPKVRKALICELVIDQRYQKAIEGEIHFVEYGSKHLQIEMSSFVPKGDFVTIVLLGKSVDYAKAGDRIRIISEYMNLPHIRRIIPSGTVQLPVCVCNPYMTVGGAKNVHGEHAAVIGDLAVSRLYKDGIYSAYLTASGLAAALLDRTDSRSNSLHKHFYPAFHSLDIDNRFGSIVFVLNRIFYSSPILSRIFYQAVLTERKTKPKRKRRLESILWQIASGDGTYRNAFLSMFHPVVIYSFLIGGVYVTLRNLATEYLFGLSWRNFERFPTGLFKEDFEEKKRELLRITRREHLLSPEFDSMYSITIKADRESILRCIGTFGSQNMKYFRPRMIKVRRVEGNGNEIGAVIKYHTPFGLLDFAMRLVRNIDDSYLLYDVIDGFGKGGVLIFNIEQVKEGVYDLYIYVALNFQRGQTFWSKLYWRLFRLLFPGYVHDVLWNHSLCKLKELAEHPEEVGEMDLQFG